MERLHLLSAISPRRRSLTLFAPLALPALAALTVPVGLGTWQVQRPRWKSEPFARIEASERSPPVPFGAAAEPFAKIVATGRFDHARGAPLGVELRGATLGAHLLTPLLRPGYPPQPVDRGWVPFERDWPLDRSEGEMAVTGFVREADRRDWLTPDDDAPGRRFYLFDPRAIGAAMGLPQAPAPFGLVALAPADATKSKGRMRRRR